MTARRGQVGLLAGALVCGAVAWWSLRGDPDALVVFCAHDAQFAETVLSAFEQRTGLHVRVKFDTEATKSLGLVEQIALMGEQCPADVFWNNEALGTMRLAAEGRLLPYRGESHARIPARWQDPDGRWCGFAARARVWMVHTPAVAPTIKAVEEAVAAGLAKGDLSRLALARPLYGTTRTHYTMLWDLLGSEAVTRWHESWRQAQVREVSGNALVARLVAAGGCDLGLTDSDDWFAAAATGAPVAMVPAELPNGAALIIPNTVAVLAGSRRLMAAQRLVDFLLSEQVEELLARSPARQIPLGPVDPTRLPAEVTALVPLLQRAYSFRDAAGASTTCLRWLKDEALGVPRAR